MPSLWRWELWKKMRNYLIKLHEEDIPVLRMMRMAMEQSIEEGNMDNDMIADIIWQIEKQDDNYREYSK